VLDVKNNREKKLSRKSRRTRSISVGMVLLLIAIGGGQLSIYIFNLDSELVGSDAIITSQNIAID
jgi:hypothetical protein